MGVTLRIAGVIGLLAALLSTNPSAAEFSGNTNPGNATAAAGLSSFTRHACAIDLAGDVRCWGQNTNGALGTGSTDSIGDGGGEMGDSLQAVDLGTGRTATQISTGYWHTCAILDNGDLKCWGGGGNGQLGYGDTNHRGDTPGELGDTLAAVDLGTGRTAVEISAGSDHTCAILDNGDLKCWGANTNGQLGYGDTDTRGDGGGEMGDNLAAVDLGTGRTAVSVSAGISHTCAILDNGDLKCWGVNTNGELGLEAAGNRGDGPGQMGDSLPAVDLGTGRTAAAISLGFSATCAILDSGDIKCWGLNVGGRLGIGDTTNRGLTPGDMGDNLPAVDLGTGRTATAVDAGNNHICAILDDSTVKCWGEGNWGQLGYGNPTALGASPTHMGDNLAAVNLGTGRTALAIAVGDGHTCTTLDNGTIKCWGYNGSGTLGIGTTANMGDGGGEMGDSLPVADLGTGVVAAGGPDPLNTQLAIMASWAVGGTPRACENDGAGNWSNCVSIPITDGSPDGTSTIRGGDWNGDGRNDVVIGNQNGTLNSCLRNADGSWTCSSNGATGRHRGIGVGDFNGDGNADFVGAIETSTDMDVCTGDGTGGFTCSRVTAPNGGRDIVVNDYDGDGDLDLAYAAWPGPSAICANDGSAGFTCTGITGTGNNLGVDQGDINEDGNVDLVFGGGGTTDELLCTGNGAGAFTCSTFNAGGYHSQAKIGDLNGDDNLDVVVAGDGVPARSCLGDGTGTLTCSDLSGAPTNAGSVDLGHIDGDNVLDALFGSTGPAPNQSCLGDGAGQFTCADVDPASVFNTQGVLLFDGYVTVDDDDGDGVANATDNCPLVANPAQTDTDGDLTGDACDTDDDNDNLSDTDETGTHGTDPLVADTDGDTLVDGDEVNTHSTNPLVTDTDGDTLADGDEINTHSTNPLVTDTDGDGYDDDVEIANGSDPLVPPAAQTITFADPADTTFDVGTFAVSPTAGSGLPVTMLAAGDCTVAGFTVTLTGAGTCTLTAQQGGDYNWEPAPDVIQTVIVAPGVQAITHSPIGPVTFGDAPIGLTASATSGLPVTITSTGPCSVSGMTLTVTGAGDCGVSFDQAGNGDWAPAATVTTTVGVAKADQTITVTPPVDMTFGTPAQTVGATATSGLPVTVTVTGPCSVSGSDVTATGTGTCGVTVSQPGDGDWNPAADATASFNITSGDQTITVGPIGDRFFDQGPVTLSPTASSGLDVTVTSTGACTNDGAVVTPTGVGTCELTFVQAGDGNWYPAPDATASFAIAPGRQTITLPEPGPLVYGQEPFQLLATATSALPVGLTTEGSCSNEATEITIVTAGTCTITASQPGDASWATAPDQTVTVAINRAPQTITMTAPTAARYGDPAVAVDLALDVAATSDLPIEFQVDGVCQIANGRLTYRSPGSCEITATQAGDGNWEPAEPVTVGFDVGRGEAEITVVTDTVGFSDDPQPAAVETSPPDLDGLEVTYDGEATVPSLPGEYELLVALANPNYAADEVTGTFTILDPVVVPDDTVSYRYISVAVDDIVDNGLPEPTDEGTVLTVTGLDPGSVVTLTAGDVTSSADQTGPDETADGPSDGLADELAGSNRETGSDTDELVEVADDDGVVVLAVEPSFDLAEATFRVEQPDGPTVLVTTEDVARFGQSEVVVGFSSLEGEQVTESIIVVEGDGLAPSSAARVVVHSTPIEIGRFTADQDGSFQETLVLPAGLEDGEHRVLVHADTLEGQLTGTWFFAVEGDGTLERLGDPEPSGPAIDPEAVADDGDGEIPDQLAMVSDDPADGAANGEANDGSGVDELAQGPAGDGEQEIDEATGLPVYDPADDPEQTVDSGVNGFTIVAVVTSAAGSAAALGSMAQTGGGMSATTGPGGSSSGGGPRHGAGRTGGGSGGGKDSGSSDESRGKGKIASGKAKGLGDGLESVAWGDNSGTWRWPMVFGLDRLSRELPDQLRVTSPLLSRVVADGSTLRALFGTGALTAPALGAALGLLAVFQTGGAATAPSLSLMVALILIGIFDASAGLAAAAVFTLGVVMGGGASSADAVRTMMGVGSLWYAVPLIAGGARKFRRPPPETWEERWQRVADIAVGSLLGAWSVQTVLKALPGLSGLALPIAEHADRVAVLALVALVLRYVVETVAIKTYPERMVMTAPVEGREPGTMQQVLSLICKTGVFVFVIEPYIGLVWQLGVVVALMVVPSFLGIFKERFPNVAVLNRVLPSGVPAILFFMVVGKTLGATLGDRIDDPATLTMATFVVLSIPGFINSMAGLVGRDSEKVRADWVGRFAGLSVVVVTYMTIRGHVDAAPMTWVPFAVAPAFLWWVNKAARTQLESPPEDEEPNAEDDNPAGGLENKPAPAPV